MHRQHCRHALSIAPQPLSAAQLFVLTGGFFVVALPGWLAWARYLSYIYYALQVCGCRGGCRGRPWQEEEQGLWRLQAQAAASRLARVRCCTRQAVQRFCSHAPAAAATPCTSRPSTDLAVHPV